VLSGFAFKVLGVLAHKDLQCGVHGMRCAWGARMARRFEDLVCWQLANELKCEVLAFTSQEPASRDFKFCDQIRDSASSATRNIAEGFGRYKPAPFAQYLGYARASIMETRSSLIDARDRKHVSETLGLRLLNLAQAALRTTTHLMREKQREAARQPKPKRAEKPSFSITLEELEAKRKKKHAP